MKRVLIAGANSYIGCSAEKWLMQHPEEYSVTTLDVANPEWEEFDFSTFDVVLSVAGVAHKKETSENRKLFYDINRDLNFRIASLAKQSGVHQFIYLSSMSVYGMLEGVITEDTIPKPNTAYGKSKLEAEIKLNELKSETFSVCIIRPPMVYGNGCKGNYQSLRKIAEKTPIVPRIKNRRSMIFIDNLCEFLKRAILQGYGGVFFPRNQMDFRTDNMISLIRKNEGKRTYRSILLGAVICVLRPFSTTLKKAFGSLYYTNDDDFEYCIVGQEASITQSL